MKKLNITKQSLQEAKELFEFKELNNSITKGQGNKAGALGEVLVRQHFADAIHQNTFDYDLIINNKKIDVKTKRFTSKFTPNKNWTLNIPNYNTKQKCDYYCFVGMSDDYKIAYLYGFIKKSDFYNIAKFNKKGQLDPKGNGKWKFRADCYNISISELKEYI